MGYPCRTFREELLIAIALQFIPQAARLSSRAAFVRQPPSCQITKMVTRPKEIIQKLAPIGVWVFLICFGLIAVDQNDKGPLIFYIGLASAALAGIMFWVRKD